MSPWIRALIAVAVALAGTYLALDSSSLSGKFGFLDQSKERIIAAAVVVGVGSVITAVDSLLNAKARRHRDAMARDIFEVAFPVWTQVSRQFPRSKTRQYFGVHFWIVPRWYWTLVPRLIRDRTPSKLRAMLRTPKLWRAARLRLKDSRGETSIGWRRGVGAIGICWRDRSDFYFDFDAEWGTALIAEPAWRSLDPAKKMGLKYGSPAIDVGRERCGKAG